VRQKLFKWWWQRIREEVGLAKRFERPCGRHMTWRCECGAITYGPALVEGAVCSMGHHGVLV
jgi:hypothetical protein